MNKLQDYCIEVNDINGIKTYIISPDLLEHISTDEELLLSLYTSPKKVKHFIEYAKLDTSAIFFAFAYFNNRKKQYTWQPVNCYKSRNFYCHVFIRTTWLCRECQQLQHGLFIMPMIEHDPIFYSDTDEKYPKVSPIFKKKTCKICKKPLQNHFLSL